MTCQNAMLDFGSIVSGRKILLFHVGKGRFGEYAAGLLASRVLAGIRDAVLRRPLNPASPAFHLYVDEFQLVADLRFAELLAEARKFGLALTLAHQFVEQLPREVLTAILGNVGTVVSLHVGPRDADVLSSFFEPVFHAGDLSSLANFHGLVRSSGGLGNLPFSIQFPPPEAGSPRTAAAVRAASREAHGRPREEVEREILASHRACAE